MNPAETGAHYDAIASIWQQKVPDTYGVSALQRAIKFSSGKGVSLDVGCGSQGRFIRILNEQGFQTEGVDISPAMIALVRERSPQSTFYVGDICRWELPKKYDFISAWDSTFHLPLEQQSPVLKKLCAGLTPGGVFIFTCGGGAAGEITGTCHGQEFGYSTLGVEEFVRLLHQFGCRCCHAEYDQYPENHVYLIAKKS